ncbi:multicopper oxidase domain-containing protein [Listeria booriae]|uniref:multicopper oxidase domain-containing protein n=1 Tax=Listeria booriae TaxID=1552123 RepID=UPI00162A8132|nr:multicopper oxidase domain-containing protein [Listeria booriae]MBC2263144.1 multicopper oxidase domain-containing protein [Listeria booriae]
MYMMFFGSSVLLLVAMAVLWSIFPFRRGRWLFWINAALFVGWCLVTFIAARSIGWEFVRQIFGMLMPMVFSPFVLSFLFAKRANWMRLVKRYDVIVSWLAVFMIVFQIPAFPTFATYVLCFGVPILVFFLLYVWEKWLAGKWKRGWIAFGSVILVVAFIFGSLLMNATALNASGDDMVMDWGGGKDSGMKSELDVTKLTGPKEAAVTERFQFTAATKKMKVPDGSTKELWLFNGQMTGPAIHVKQGDVVEVTLTNENIEDGVTIHWHGYDVPIAEDGVPDISQKAVAIGESYTYRFKADTVGTFWYHSHSQSSEQVGHGLFGSLIVDPKTKPDDELDMVAFVAPKYIDNDGALISSDEWPKQLLKDTKIRLRLTNAHNKPQKIVLNGVPFKVATIDGNEVNQPTYVEGKYVQIPAGGRVDLTFVMPNNAVRIFDAKEESGGWVFQSERKSAAPSKEIPEEAFQRESYGTKMNSGLDVSKGFDREFTMVFDSKLAFFDGMVHHLWTINGKLYPNTPMLMVSEGDLVKTTFVNRSYSHHPMHLHGHKMLVLTRNGKATTGSPWWTDTLNVAPGETYEVAFKADNPGIWMDHCHNLDHATNGMMMHLQYDNVYTPFSGHTHE